MLDRIILDVESTKDDFKMDMTIDFNELNILVGMNGSGKTLILKFAWFAGYLLQAYKVMLAVDPKNSDRLFAEMVTKVFKWTFDEPQDMFGTISIEDKDHEKFSFTVAFKDAGMDYFDIDIIDPKEFSVGSITNVQYNSKEARTFEQYARYLKIKKKFGINQLTEEGLNDICDIFKLYDVLWFENLQRIVSDIVENGLNPIFTSKVGENILSQIFAGAESSSNDSDRFILAGIKEEEGVPIFVMADGSEKKATSLSSGQQSMMMMTVFGAGAAAAGPGASDA